MRTIGVVVQPDHLERIANSRTPFPAIFELIWNALDADANTVHVKLVQNELSGLEKIIVEDDGHGIPFDDSEDLFANLGGSRKRRGGRSPGGRILHGQRGEGRFRAFGLGEYVEWHTVYLNDGKTHQYSIRGCRSRLGQFEIDDPTPCPSKTGTIVTIDNLAERETELQSEHASSRIAEELALYLRQYSNIRVFYDGQSVDSTEFEKRRHVEQVTVTLPGTTTSALAELTIIEWTTHQVKTLTLCDRQGFPFHVMPAKILASGFYFTAYLCSDYILELQRSGLLVLEDMDPGLRGLLQDTKRALREYFRGRAAEEAANLVEEWKAEDIYPYKTEPVSLVEVAERQMFDVLALNLHTYLPSFGGADVKGKRLSLRLLRSALEENPGAVQKILGEVLDLPVEKQNELADLLDRTSLASLINASKLIADRLDFLSFLESMLFERENRKTLLERTQLHRILADNVWIFGEELSLAVDDQSLTEVLRNHIRLLGRTELIEKPVTMPDGSVGIVDLMLSKRVWRNQGAEREHLVVELKRPQVKLDLDIEAQIRRYATAVADDERFRACDARWVFWAVSNDLDRVLQRAIEGQTDREDGLVMNTSNIRVWMKTWGQLIDASRARYSRIQEELNYNVTRDDAVMRLRAVYSKYLPPREAISDDTSSSFTAEAAEPSSAAMSGRANSTGTKKRSRRKQGEQGAVDEGPQEVAGTAGPESSTSGSE
jgi:hypothetical protein